MTLPLEGVKVVDVATLGAGPWLATRLADFGADVVKVEHPLAGDPMRLLGWFDDGVPLWWKIDSRNKRCITADLKQPDGTPKRLLVESRVEAIRSVLRTAGATDLVIAYWIE